MRKKQALGMILLLSLLLTGCGSNDVVNKGTLLKLDIPKLKQIKEDTTEEDVLLSIEEQEDVNEEVEETNLPTKEDTRISNDTSSNNSTTSSNQDTVNQTSNNSTNPSTANNNQDNTSNNQSNTSTPSTPTPSPEPPSKPSYNYTVGNCGELYSTYDEANAVAREYKKNYVSDTNYISGYTVIQTYDKFTINYEYRYWQ